MIDTPLDRTLQETGEPSPKRYGKVRVTRENIGRGFVLPENNVVCDAEYDITAGVFTLTIESEDMPFPDASGAIPEVEPEYRMVLARLEHLLQHVQECNYFVSFKWKHQDGPAKIIDQIIAPAAKAYLDANLNNLGENPVILPPILTAWKFLIEAKETGLAPNDIAVFLQQEAKK